MRRQTKLEPKLEANSASSPPRHAATAANHNRHARCNRSLQAVRGGLGVVLGWLEVVWGGLGVVRGGLGVVLLLVLPMWLLRT